MIPHDDYRVTIGLDVYEAAAAEVHFAMAAGPQSPSRRLVVRLSRDRGAVLGIRDGDRGALRELGHSVPFPSPSWFRDRRPYLEVRIERTGQLWAAWFHGELVGRVTDDGTRKAPEIRLLAENGRARVDSVVLEPLHPQGQ
jgi:hypothetical protein